MSQVQRKCQCCGGAFMARSADVKRGWARFCSKSCKAVKQEQRTGQYAALTERAESDDFAYLAEDGGWDAHKGFSA